MTRNTKTTDTVCGCGIETDERKAVRHCAAQAIGHGTPEEAEAMYDELLNLIYKHSR